MLSSSVCTCLPIHLSYSYYSQSTIHCYVWLSARLSGIGLIINPFAYYRVNLLLKCAGWRNGCNARTKADHEHKRKIMPTPPPPSFMLFAPFELWSGATMRFIQRLCDDIETSKCETRSGERGENARGIITDPAELAPFRRHPFFAIINSLCLIWVRSGPIPP